MSGLTRDGTAEPNSRDQILRRERGQGKFRFPCSADHKKDWQPYPVDVQSAESDDHTHTHMVRVLLILSTCGELGPDVHALIQELAHRRVNYSSELHSEESRRLAEGTEVARLRRRFSFVLQQALSSRTRHHLCRQGVSLTSSNCNHMTRLQERDRGAAAGNYDLQQQASSSRQDPFRNIVANTNDRDRRENGEGVTRWTQEQGRSNDIVEEVEEREVDNRKRKRQDSASPLSRLIRRCRRSSNQ